MRGVGGAALDARRWRCGAGGTALDLRRWRCGAGGAALEVRCSAGPALLDRDKQVHKADHVRLQRYHVLHTAQPRICIYIYICKN